jgi:hypothetical protein
MGGEEESPTNFHGFTVDIGIPEDTAQSFSGRSGWQYLISVFFPPFQTALSTRAFISPLKQEFLRCKLAALSEVICHCLAGATN